MATESPSTVILGAGIIGVSTAYYLSQTGNTTPGSIHLVDPANDLFHCASGFAAGFLAADWFAPSVASLGTLSFRLHKELADAHNGRKTWGYSSSTGISYSQDIQDSEAAVGGSGEDWLRDGTSRAHAAGVRDGGASTGPIWLKKSAGASMEVISQHSSTAQIDPLRLCRFLLAECVRRGVKVHQPARALSISQDESGRFNGIRISQHGTETEIPCTRLIISSGAWAPRTFSALFPKATTRIPIAPLAGHSLLVRNPFFKASDAEEKCHAVFATDTLGFSPEYFSRTEGEVYLAGLNSTTILLPETAQDVRASPEAIQKLKDCAATMMGRVNEKEVEILRESLCFRPVTSSGRPIIARVPDNVLGSGLRTKGGSEGGVFIVAGHGAWGISHSLGTGLCVSELVEGRETSASLSALVLPG
ncbi:FAD dependent oxidoreductase [Dendryphion nanum]|uniref:FAD dependent oxidoreductase n=1 Tax=Dendryphion nanum TaxID=256645 RepID=A0A9P9J2G4_9PLEO|nr:FAD dependent oxidoreductase [Dendryphion nanum]